MSRIEMMEFPYGSFLEVRLEFVLLRDNELEAKIMRIIENWMIDQKKAWLNECAQAASDGRPEPSEPDYFVTLSYAQIIAQLYMFNSSRKGVGKEVVEGKKNSIHRNTITKAVSALIEDKYVITRPNPNKTKEYEATQYTLNLPLIQEHMRRLPKNAMSYLGSNGRIDGVPCPDFSKPPKEIPCAKFVHGSGDAQKSDIPCTKNVHPMQDKSASPPTKNVHGDAQKSSHLIDREIDKRIDYQIDKERKNGTSQQKANVTARQETHSSILSQPSSQNKISFSQETKPEEVTLTEEEQHVYDLACQRFFVSKPPEVTPTVKEHCGKIAKAGIKTSEQMKDLESIARQEQRLGNKTIYLGNLARGLNGWLQMQNSPVSLPTERKAGYVYSSYDDPDYVDDSFYPAKRKGAN